VNHESDKLLILIVDDDAEAREALADLLFNEGYAVICAENGRQALDYLSGSPLPALIILDLMMPVMSGWDPCAAKDRCQIEIAARSGHDCQRACARYRRGCCSP
jgi:CheY-like chemotaxis protein